MKNMIKGVADKVADRAGDELVEKIFTKRSKVVFNLPERNRYFSGRHDIINELRDNFYNNDASCQKVTLKGLGGIGKTQIALEYVHVTHEEGKYKDLVGWFNVDSLSSMRSDCISFLIMTGLLSCEHDVAERNISENELVMIFKNWLNEHKSWVLVFDNADTEESIKVLELFASGLHTGQIIVTSREKRLKFGVSLDIDKFSQSDAEEFAIKNLSVHWKNEQDHFNDLFERLGYLALALDQAIAFIVVRDCTIADYLNTLDKLGLKVFKSDSAKLPDYNKIVTTTWTASINAIEREDARQLFYLCSYMSADDIPLDFFVLNKEKLPEPLCSNVSDEEKALLIVEDLEKYSMVTIKNRFIDVHRLVQEVVRDELSNKGDLQWFEYCLNMVSDYLPNDYSDDTDFKQFEKIDNHVKMVLSYLGAKPDV